MSGDRYAELTEYDWAQRQGVPPPDDDVDEVDDVGPPAPGEGDALPNPEMTVEC